MSTQRSARSTNGCIAENISLLGQYRALRSINEGTRGETWPPLISTVSIDRHRPSGHNHIEWVTGTFPEEQMLGFIMVCLCQKRSAETAPSKDMWLANLAPFRQLFDEFLQELAALQRLPPLQRVPEMEAFALRAEWQPEAIFLRLRGVQILNMPKQ